MATTEEVYRKISENGLDGKVGTDDYALARTNPDDAMKIIDNKIAYLATSDPAVQGLLARETAAIRAKNNYMTDAAGMKTLARLDHASSPSSASASARGYADYDKTVMENYRKTVEEAKARAQRDLVAKANAYTGGYGNSYAAAATAEAGTKYDQMIADKEAEIAQGRYNRNVERARLAASVGDYSYLKAMGINTSAVEPKEEAPVETPAEEPIEENGIGLFEAAKLSGYPAGFIANHYKEYGFNSPSNLYSDYKNWAEETSTAVASATTKKPSQTGETTKKGENKKPTQDYDGLFAAALASGRPESYIANHYKEYGFTSTKGLYNEYLEWEDARPNYDHSNIVDYLISDGVPENTAPNVMTYGEYTARNPGGDYKKYVEDFAREHKA